MTLQKKKEKKMFLYMSLEFHINNFIFTKAFNVNRKTFCESCKTTKQKELKIKKLKRKEKMRS